MLHRMLVAAVLLVAATEPQDCDTLRSMIMETYDFSPSELSGDEKGAAAAAMTEFWEYVEASPDENLECLRAALVDELATPWFLFDGSSLLVNLDPSQESKALQARLWCSVNLDDVSGQYWIETLARRGVEGFDVSVAGDRWLAYEDAGYFVARHGMFKVGSFEGAMFLFGSMDESHATPGLLRVVGERDHPGRSVAIALLAQQGTPESWRALGAIDVDSLPPSAGAALLKFRSGPPQMPAGEGDVELSREEIVGDLLAALGDETATPLHPSTSAAAWLRGAVATLQPEDIELVRRARRQRVTVSSDEAVYEYMKYSAAIQALTWSAEYFDD
ncbi:MAG: hypothetical protein ACI9EF_001008 [Pseudohongiellaceae bacterium]|jgi:hypothetical protein